MGQWKGCKGWKGERVEIPDFATTSQSRPPFLAALLRQQAKSRISDSFFWDGDEGGDEGGFGGQRRLQVDGSDLSDVLLNSLRPADAFDCPAVAGL